MVTRGGKFTTESSASSLRQYQALQTPKQQKCFSTAPDTQDLVPYKISIVEILELTEVVNRVDQQHLE